MYEITYTGQFGITVFSGLRPLSRILDNGIINNGRKDSVIDERQSVLEKLKEAPVQAKPEHLQKTAIRSVERGLE